MTGRIVAVLAGPEASRLWAGRDEAWRTALHEAGHCVAAELAERGVVRTATVIPTKDYAGEVRFTPTSGVPQASEKERSKAMSDRRRALAMLSLIEPNQGWPYYLRRLRELQQQARYMTERHWFEIVMVAAALRSHGRLEGDEVRAVMTMAARV